MGDDAGRAVVDLRSGLAEAQAQVHVLERVAEGRVEAAGALEGRAPDQHACGGHRLKGPRPLDGRMVGREARVDVPRAAVLADRDAGVLHGAVGEQQLRPDRGRLRVGVGMVDQRIQPSGVRLGVVVQEDEQLAARRGRARRYRRRRIRRSAPSSGSAPGPGWRGEQRRRLVGRRRRPRRRSRTTCAEGRPGSHPGSGA